MAKVDDKFAKWIMEFGIHKLADMMKAHQVTIESWLCRDNLPTPPSMRKLVRLADGAVSYADIIDPYFKKHPGRDLE